MSFYTLSASQSDVLYSESEEMILIIEYLSNLRIPDGCPLKSHIAIDAMKQWATICKESKIVCSKKSMIELLDKSYTQLYNLLTEEIEDYDLKMKCWNESGINFYREKLKEDNELYQARNKM